MKKTDRLKFPQIASLLYGKQLDIEDWIPQIEQGVDSDFWTLSTIKKILESELKEFSLLLAKVNGAKLKKDEKEEYGQYKKFFSEMNDVLRDAKKRKRIMQKTRGQK